MTIKKLENGSYELKMYIPKDVQNKLGTGSRFEKRFKTRKEARNAELEIKLKISDIQSGREVSLVNKDITFEEFYHDYWIESYKAGQTTFTNTPPVPSTIFQTQNMFRLHILPLLGKYSLTYLMSNKQLVISLLTGKANEYANFKQIRSYVNSVFDWAEEMEIIEINRLKKSISRIKPVKKVQIARQKNEDDLYLNADELSDWLKALETDLKTGQLSFMDYVLFFITFLLSDRKSETYALQWKHIDFETNEIHIVQALDRFGSIKSTKGEKKTTFKVSTQLMDLLKKWKEIQKKELKIFHIRQTANQLVFTYTKNTGEVNQPLHPDYLNYRMKATEKRHPELKHATPHMLRHTGATLARKAGISIDQISEALTHTNTDVTRDYINTNSKVEKTAGQIALDSLKSQ